MITEISTVFEKKDKVDFIIDNDPNMSWIADFDSSKFKRLFVVIDKNVNKEFGRLIFDNLKNHKKEIFTLEVESTEHSKSINFYPKLINFFEQYRANRFDLVIAIGGGIITDLVSFTVSTFMRGLPLITIPTTLIGQIDATTAGKTCLNTDNSKNVLGTFYYPLTSYNNINFLKKNKKYYLRQGFSEVFKYGLLISENLVNLLEKYKLNPPENILIEMIKQAIESRIEIRKKDPLVSNLGHTFGHAVEKMSDFNILHGDAISAGTIVSLYFSEKIGLMKKEKREKIINLMKKIGLNIYLEKGINIDKWVDLMLRDKKSSADELNLVLIEDISRPYQKDGQLFYKTKPDIIHKFLKEFLAIYPYQIKDCANFLQKEELSYGEQRWE